jgi:hypothetical protein
MPSKAKQSSGKESRPAARAKVMTGPHPALLQIAALLPLVVFYELAVPFTTLKSGWYHAIDLWSQRGLARIGLTQYYLPGLLVLATLLVVHLVRREPWRIRPAQLWKLWAEALVWTVPLFVLYLLFTMPVQRLLGVSLSLVARGPADLFSNVILSIGAGLFEEFVFRLALVSAALFLLQRLWNVPLSAAQVVGVCFAAAVFSAAHHFGPGAPPYDHLDFLFRVAAGIYLGAVYILRGFATAAIVHAAFNIILACWAFW